MIGVGVEKPEASKTDPALKGTTPGEVADVANQGPHDPEDKGMQMVEDDKGILPDIDINLEKQGSRNRRKPGGKMMVVTKKGTELPRGEDSGASQELEAADGSAEKKRVGILGKAASGVGGLFRRRSRAGPENAFGSLTDEAAQLGRPDGHDSSSQAARHGIDVPGGSVSVASRGLGLGQEKGPKGISGISEPPSEVEVKNVVDGAVVSRDGVLSVPVVSGVDTAGDQEVATRGGVVGLLQNAGVGLGFGALGLLLFLFGKPENGKADGAVEDDSIVEITWAEKEGTECMQSMLWHSA